MAYRRFFFAILNIFSLALRADSAELPKPDFTSSGSTVIGDTATFTCSYDFSHFAAGDNSILYFNDLTWKKEGNDLGKIRTNKAGDFLKELLTSDTDVAISYQPIDVNRGLTSTLTIKNVDCNDAVEYTCVVDGKITNPGKGFLNVRVNQTAKLVVTKEPETPSRLELSSNAIIADVATAFTCQGNVGLPAKKLTMYIEKNSFKTKDLDTASQTTTISDDACTRVATVTVSTVLTQSRNEDEYSVVCEVEGLRKRLALNIEFPVSEVTIELNSRVLPNNTEREIHEAERYTISCVAQSNPRAAYEIRYTPSDQTQTTRKFGQQVLNRNAAKSHAGSYHCVASNTLSNNQNYTATSPYIIIKVLGGDDDGLSTGAIVGAVIGALAALVIIIIVVFCCYKHRSRPKKYSSSAPPATKAANNASSGSLYKESEPDLYKSHKQPSTPGNYNTGYNRQDDYLNHIPMSTEGRSRNPVMLNESPYGYSSPYPDSPYPDSLASQYSHSRPV